MASSSSPKAPVVRSFALSFGISARRFRIQINELRWFARRQVKLGEVACRMKHPLLAIAVLLFSLDAWACRTLPPSEQRRQDRADIAEQKAMVREMARAAEAIYVAKAIEVSDSANRANFVVLRAVKGDVDAGEVVQFELANEISVGCKASDGFKNVYAREGGEYLLYVIEGALTRTGEMKRHRPEISFREELREIRAALASNIG